jgi:adenylate cyclase
MEDHADRAFKAAQSMVREVEALNRELTAGGKPTIAIGIGLDTGDVVAGHVGSDKRLEFTLIGVPVNNSAYLSKVRPPLVLLSETTRDALTDSLTVIDYEPMLLKGALAPQAIYQFVLEVELSPEA